MIIFRHIENKHIGRVSVHRIEAMGRETCSGRKEQGVSTHIHKMWF